MSSAGNQKLETRNPNAGFTLLELMIVLSLVIVMLALSAIHFAGRMPSARLDAAGRDLSSAIRYAKILAVSKGEMQAFTMDLDQKTYGINGSLSKSIPSGISVTVLSREGERSNGAFSLDIRATGSMEERTIRLSSGNRHFTIRTDPVTGTVVHRE